jgi:hypothetical protein
LRLFEHAGKAGDVRLRLAFPVSAVRKTRLDGTPLAEAVLSEDERSWLVHVAPHEIVTVEIDPAPSTPGAT